MKDKIAYYRVVCIVLITTLFISTIPEKIFHLLTLNLEFLRTYEILGHLTFYLLWVLPVFFALSLLYGFKIKNSLRELGMDKSLLKDISFTFLITLPMMVGYFLFASSKEFNLVKVITLALLPGFNEELIFRGFIFGQLFNRARWGFIPAVAFNAFLFATGHLYQSFNLVSAIGIFLVTFIGSGWFAWLWAEWENNPWVPAGLHFFMNLWWIIFKMGHNALGGNIANLFRILTIALSIIVTVKMRKVKGRFLVTRLNLLKNNIVSA